MDIFREQGETCPLQLKVHYRTMQSLSECLINDGVDSVLIHTRVLQKSTWFNFIRITLILRNSKPWAQPSRQRL